MTDTESFRFDACLKKMLGKSLTPEEREVVREVNRIQGWDRDSDGRPKAGDVEQAPLATSAGRRHRPTPIPLTPQKD